MGRGRDEGILFGCFSNIVPHRMNQWQFGEYLNIVSKMTLRKRETRNKVGRRGGDEKKKVKRKEKKGREGWEGKDRKKRRRERRKGGGREVEGRRREGDAREGGRGILDIVFKISSLSKAPCIFKK